jgi:hypothetical protein
MEKHRMPRHISLVALLALLASCGGTESGTGTAAVQASTVRSGITLTDTRIAELLYAGTPRVPADFFDDAPPAGSGPVATYQLQNSQLGTAGARHELCTDDVNQARDWSNTVSGGAEPLLSESTTGRYFEFQRQRNTTPVVTVRARVFRCAYADRSAVNLADVQGPAGALNLRPIDAAALRMFSEYLWNFSEYNNADNVVLASRGTPVNGSLEHEIVMAQLIRAGSGGCDRVSVSTWRHRVDVGSGAVVREWVPLWEFGARQGTGVVTTC